MEWRISRLEKEFQSFTCFVIWHRFVHSSDVVSSVQWNPTSSFEQSTEIEPEVSFPLWKLVQTQERSLKRYWSLVYLQIFGISYVRVISLQNFYFKSFDFSLLASYTRWKQITAMWKIKGAAGEKKHEAKLLKSRFESFTENRFENSSSRLLILQAVPFALRKLERIVESCDKPLWQSSSLDLSAEAPHVASDKFPFMKISLSCKVFHRHVNEE